MRTLIAGGVKVIRGFASYGNSGEGRALMRTNEKLPKIQTAENDLILSLLIRVGLGIDLSTLIDNFKFCSKYANAQNRGDVVSALIRSCERAGAYDELTKLIDKTKGSHNCPDCIERRAKDMRRMQRDMRRLQKGN
ncbi:uridine kinase [Vibrio phage J14]|nr:uridine kinase [Vibrio phage J14]